MGQLTQIEILIHEIRGERVILDSDLARIYEVAVKALNQAVKRNRERFPDDFAFRLTKGEWESLRSKSITSSASAENRSQIVTGSQKHRDPRFPPYAFTEHGAIMAATVLNSKQAVAMSVFVVRAFVQMRDELAANRAILKRLAQIDKTLVQHDAALRNIYRKLLPLLEPTPLSPKRRIGFGASDKS